MSQRISRRSFLASASLLSAQKLAPPPNIVFVLVDDLRWDELGCSGHPFAQTPNIDRLTREGAMFQNAFAVTPLCSPSRASFLTGLYPRKHQITDNVDRSPTSHRLLTWPKLLHDSGYETAFLGKWHMGVDDSPRPGFDHWVSFPGQGESINPLLNENGKTARVKGYITDILNQRAVDLLQSPRSKPFCLYLSHKAIHPTIQQNADGSVTGFGSAEEFIAAPRHRNLYSGQKIPRRGNYQVVPKNKPALLQSIEGVAPLSPKTATDDATILNRMRMTKAIDEGVGEMVEALRKAGQLENTMFVVTSDHGYFYGEHCLNPERRLAYEEAIRIPLIARYPKGIRAGLKPKEMVASIDIASTMLEVAGVGVPQEMQGESLVPLLAGKKKPWREALLFEYHTDRVFPRIRNMGYRAVRSERWKLIQYQELQDADELYDLKNDPYELNNVIASSAEVPKLKMLLAGLDRKFS
jgi:N-acetylglucosamine-6-sulfatase